MFDINWGGARNDFAGKPKLNPTQSPISKPMALLFIAPPQVLFVPPTP